MSNNFEMYSTDDSDSESAVVPNADDTSAITVESFPTTTVINIGKHQVTVINPVYVTNIKTQLDNANRKLSAMDRTLKRMNFELANAIKEIRRLQQELDKKVDYE